MDALACASSEWAKIDWSKVTMDIDKLQKRIATAYMNGRFDKVRVLQRILVSSFCSRALAVRQVTRNRGKRTPGVDGVVWNTPDEKMAAVRSLNCKDYQPLPLRRVYIRKQNGKLRSLGIPTMHDRAMQKLYQMARVPIAEQNADPHSYAYRHGPRLQDAIQRCLALLNGANAPEWILWGDIEGCFDHINHDWMIEHVLMDKVILHKFLKCGYIENGILHPR